MPEHNIDRLKEKQLVTFYLNRTMFNRLRDAAEISSRKHTDIIKEAIFGWLEANQIELPITAGNKEK